MKKFILLLSVIPTFVCAQTTLVTWDFEGVSPGTAPTIVATSLVTSASNAIASTGVTINRSTGTVTNLGAGGGSGGVAAYAAGTAAGSFLNANGFGTSENSGLYVSFSVTLSSGIGSGAYALDGISFDFANGGSSGPRGAEVTYRVGTSGAFTSLGATQVPNNTAGNFGRFNFSPSGSISLTAGDVVEFRFLGYANTTGSNIRFDNVAISVAAVPEPSAYAVLAGLSAVGFAALRRRRRG
jgi:hypothetical protein